MERPPTSSSPSYSYYSLSLPMLLSAFFVGVLVGAIGWLINLFLQHYFIEPVFCASPDSFSACANGGTIAWALAHLLVVGASVVALVRFAVYRPLLVVIAALVTVWGMNSWLGPQEWWSATLWQALLFGLSYGAYAWLARINQFWLAAVTTVVVVVLWRLVLSWA